MLAVSRDQFSLPSVVGALWDLGFHELLKGEDVRAMEGQTGRSAHKHLGRKISRTMRDGCDGWFFPLLTAPSSRALSASRAVSTCTHDGVFRRVFFDRRREVVEAVLAVNE